MMKTYASTCIALLASTPLLGQNTGSVDPTFDPGSGFEVAIQLFQTMRVKAMPDGKVLVGGDFTSYDGLQQGSFLRLNEDGSHDEAFNSNNNVVGMVHDITVDENTGKIVLAGIVQLGGGTPSGGMAVLDPDGSVDETFSTGSGFTGNNLRVTAVAVQGDKYLVGGRFYQYQGSTRRFFTRLNNDGSVDPSFTQPFNSYLDGGITKILVMPSQDFVVIGALGFDSFSTDARLWYFNANGSLNATLTSAMGQINGQLRDIHRLENGQFLILGSMTSYAGQSVSGGLIRINADGSLDNTFSSGLTGLTQGGVLGTWTERIAVQEDGRILVVGYFSNVAGTTYNSIVRLNSTGAIDTEWNSGAGFNFPATDVALSNEGRIYVVGRFSEYDNVPRSGIVRIMAEPGGNTGILANDIGAPILRPNPATDHLVVEASEAMHSYQVLDAAGKVVMEQRGPSSTSIVLDVKHLRPGTYLLRTWHDARSRTTRFIVM